MRLGRSNSLLAAAGLLTVLSVHAVFGIGCMPEPRAPHLVLASRGRSSYRIVVPWNASPSTVHGAIELQMFLQMMTGAELPIVSDRVPPGEREIIVGRSSRLGHLGVLIDFNRLGDEGYVLRTVGNHLIIAGGDLRGSMYGVYGLLEDHLGCRWFTPGVSRIPHFKRLEITALDESVVPVLEYREPYTWEAFDGDWAARNHMNRNSKDGSIEQYHGGKIEWVPGMFVHTFDKLVPPDTYFRSHREYFSQVRGKRLGKKTQLCCTNEDVVKIVTEGVLRAFREHPAAQVISVSQNDWDNHCECPKCRALAEEEDSDMAPVLWMVNRVAEAVEKEFPGKLVETLAYQWTRRPPKTMKPRPNVVVRLSPIECCFSHPMDRCDSPENIAFAADLRAWSRVADRLWIWNYVTSFAHYFVPFPDLWVRGENIRFYIGNNVTGIFQQDIYTTPGGELSELSAYLNAKLLWNPSYNTDTAIDEFLTGVYGPAAASIREYIDMLHDKVERDNIHMGVFQGPDAEYLTDDILYRADSLWTEAENSAAELPDVFERVRIARLSVDYAIIWRDRYRGDALIPDHETYQLTVNPAFRERLDRFCHIAERAGVLKLSEYDCTIEEFRADIYNTVTSRDLIPRSPVEGGDFAYGVLYRYYEGDWKRLPDFSRLRPVKTGSTNHFTLPFAGGSETCGFTFRGNFISHRDGVYTFYTRSDGYSSLKVGDTVVVVNVGPDPVRERNGFVALKAGLHPVEVTFFTEAGGSLLEVSFREPGAEKVEIPPENLLNAQEKMRNSRN